MGAQFIYSGTVSLGGLTRKVRCICYSEGNSGNALFACSVTVVGRIGPSYRQEAGAQVVQEMV